MAAKPLDHSPAPFASLPVMCFDRDPIKTAPYALKVKLNPSTPERIKQLLTAALKLTAVLNRSNSSSAARKLTFSPVPVQVVPAECKAPERRAVVRQPAPVYLPREASNQRITKAFFDSNDLKNCSSIKFNNCTFVDNSFAEIGECSRLEQLQLISCRGITPLEFAQLKALRELRILNLAYCALQLPSGDGPINSEAIDVVSNLSELVELSIAGSSIDITGAARLSRLTCLQNLDLGGCKRLSSEDIAGLIPLLDSLVKVDLSTCNLSDAVLRSLSELSELQDLSLCRAKNISLAGISALMHAPKLARLDLSNSDVVTKAMCDEIARCRPQLALTVERCRNRDK